MFPVMVAYSTEHDTSSLLHDAVRHADCTPYQVNSVTESLEVLRQQKPAILIVGVTFDGSNILDVIPIFRHLQKDIKIILLADSASEGFLRQARAAGIFYHALEPRDVEDSEELQLALQCAKEASLKKTQGIWQRLTPMFGAR